MNDTFRNIAEGIKGADNNKTVSEMILNENIQLHAGRLKDYLRTKKQLKENCIKDKRKLRNLFRVHKEMTVIKFLKRKKIITRHNEMAGFMYKKKQYTLKELLEEFIDFMYLEEK